MKGGHDPSGREQQRGQPRLLRRGPNDHSRNNIACGPCTVDFRNFIVFFWAETLAH